MNESFEVSWFIEWGGYVRDSLEEARILDQVHGFEERSIMLIEHEGGEIIECWLKGERYLMLKAESFGALADGEGCDGTDGIDDSGLNGMQVEE